MIRQDSSSRSHLLLGSICILKHYLVSLINHHVYIYTLLLLLAASTDQKCHLIDTQTFEILRTYKPERPCNTAAISPLFDHVAIGGGQDAAAVTTTAGAAGKFEACFMHKTYAEEFGRVRGHFGPLNAIAFSPDGKGFTTGGEDGYVRLHHFSSDYLTTKFF